MKYQYRFGTGFEDVELDEEWVSVLKELDRVERNDNIKVQKASIHYDAFGFEPDFLGKDDLNLAAMLNGSPAFEYAISHLLPRHQEILFRRAVNGEKFADIGKTYNVSASAIHHYYTKISGRFRKFYEEGVWLHSNQNTPSPESDRIHSIPFGLTPAQVMVIRAYRCQYRSQEQIAQLVGVPLNRVKRCLHDNPILETRCPGCGKSIKQDPYGPMQVFCNAKCYYGWFRKYGIDTTVELKTTQGKEYLTQPQKMAVDYYRQRFLSMQRIREMTGLSEQIISAYSYAHPLPYTLCTNCGTEIHYEAGQRILKYCSKRCRDVHCENAKKYRRKAQRDIPEEIIPTADQLYCAISFWEMGYSHKRIAKRSGLDMAVLETLFRFYPTPKRQQKKKKH